ncbi:hypothetical protein FACS189490_10880 [Clostridia bacterium]|nr:hypothetical protein FACS189490_10880 [Clostridia bacterium]
MAGVVVAIYSLDVVIYQVKFDGGGGGMKSAREIEVMRRWYIHVNTGHVLSEGAYGRLPRNRAKTSVYAPMGQIATRVEAKKAAKQLLKKLGWGCAKNAIGRLRKKKVRDSA